MLGRPVRRGIARMALALAMVACLAAIAGPAAAASAPRNPGGTARPGTQLWAARYKGPGYLDAAGGDSVAASPSGRDAFVTGYIDQTGSAGNDFGTVACNAATGALLWARRYNGPAGSRDDAAAVGVSPSVS